MTNLGLHQTLFAVARRVALFPALLLLLSVARLAPPVFAAEASEPASLEHTLSADPGSQHASAVRSGVLGTRDGLTLRLTTDLGSVNIVQIDGGAPPVVRYTVHIETDARGPAAQALLDSYSLKAKPSYSGVEITGTLPPQAARSADAQFWVQFEVAVPRGYNVEVITEAGDITTADIGGTASLHTQGGNIKTGRIGTTGVRDASRGRSVAKLETEGGHIQVQEVVAGDLTAITGGGHINLGEVRGSVRAQTGGGGIRMMYVSGPIELESSSGSICLTRVAGALQAATSGGQIDFGEVRGSVRAQTG